MSNVFVYYFTTFIYFAFFLFTFHLEAREQLSSPALTVDREANKYMMAMAKRYSRSTTTHFVINGETDS